MPKNNMNTQRLQDLANAYGANIQRWPLDEQHLAQSWCEQYPKSAHKIFAEAKTLDELLDTARRPVSEISLLQARILKTASQTSQNAVSRPLRKINAANQGILNARKTQQFAMWKSVAATLIMATGLGFGIGQMAAADTVYLSAEALLSISMQSDYEEVDLNGDGL